MGEHGENMTEHKRGNGWFRNSFGAAFVGAALLALVIWGCSKKSASTSSSSLTNNGDPAGSNLVVAVTNNGSGAGGTITSSPAALDCSATCAHSFSTGTASIILTATPNSDSTVSFGGGFNCGSSNCTPLSSWGSVSCSGNTCTVVILSTHTASLTAAFTLKSQTSGNIPGLAQAIAQENGLCQAVQTVDPGAVSSCGNACQSGSVIYSFSNSGSQATSNPITVKGTMTETFSNCEISENGSTNTVTLNGAVTENFTNTTIDFNPASDYNNSNWTSITVNGDPTLSASNLSVSANGGAAQTCSIGESLNFNNGTNYNNGGGISNGTTSFSGNSGCVAGQGGSLSGLVRRKR